MVPEEGSAGDVRTRILDVATHLFATKGYGSTSVREVVEAAGVTKPTLYYYFDSKAALFKEVVGMHLDGLGAFLRVVIDGPGTVRERLFLFIEGYVNSALEHKDVVRLLATAHRPTDQNQPSVDLMSTHLRKMSALRELFEEGIASGELRSDLDLDHTVLAFTGMVNLQTMACVHGMPVTDGFADILLDLFYRGVSR